MRTTLLIFLMLLAFKGYSQYNLYTSNNGMFLEEDKIRSHFESIQKTLPATLEISAIIYHKVFKKDTVINYFSLSVSKKSAIKASGKFEFVYKQDSTFLLIDHKLPAFKLVDMDGKEVTSNDLLGKPTLINFWAIYCGPCILEMPQLSKIKEKYKDKMNFVSITENNKVDDKLAEFLKNKDFNFQVLDQGEGYKRELKIGALPKNLFIDRKGVLRDIQGNYPMLAVEGQFKDMNDKDNYFIKLIEDLIRESE